MSSGDGMDNRTIISGAKVQSKTLVVAAVLVFLVASLLPEAFTDRYGATAFASRTPVAPALAALSRVINLMVVAITAFLLLRNYTTRSESIGREPALSQLPVWLPYIVAWVLGVILGTYPGTTGYSLISLLIVLGVAMVRADPSSVPFTVSLTAWTFRTIIIGSLLVGVLWPDRAFAPFEVWPGGWREGEDRLQGLLPHPNTLAWVAALAAAFEVFGPRKAPRGPSALASLFFLGAALLVLFLTGSRTAALSLFAGGLSVALYAGIRKSDLFKYGAITLGFPLFALGMLGIVTAGFTFESFNGRMETWEIAWLQFTDNVIAGTGPGAYLYEDKSIAGYAHNQILQTLSELGIFGLLALILHMYFLLRLIRSAGMNGLGICATVMWFVMFISENLLRFAAQGFVFQIVLFQMTILVALSAGSRKVD